MYLIPQPKEWRIEDTTYILATDHVITISGTAPSAEYRYAAMLRDIVASECGYSIPVVRGNVSEKGISLNVDPASRPSESSGSKQEGQSAEEAYRIRVNCNGIEITAATQHGLFYGIQTLRQILQQCGPVIPFMEIADSPDFAHRGFYHDVTRGRIPTLDYLKKLVDKMAHYKLNQLHLYVEHSFRFRDFSEVWRDDTPLTPDDILELDAYCRERFIDLVPSIATFGHLYKVLRTRSFRHLCELPGKADEPFGFVDRMRHHTLDVSNPESMRFIKSLIEEYMPLFSSHYFNIGADETFDLGKGRSSALADQRGTDRLYLDFVKELCEYVIQKGKIPMFWGDMISSSPESIRELPGETICLNWGYEPDVTKESTLALSKAGAAIYNCPGVNGWDELVPRIKASYQNIQRMSSYAREYGAVGLLNTDWGDCGHINHPDFSVIGMIYGAAFSWSADVPDLAEMNHRISVLEFSEPTGQFVSELADISEMQIFRWRDLVDFMEGESAAEKENTKPLKRPENYVDIEHVLCRMDTVERKLYGYLSTIPRDKRASVKPYLTAIRGIRLLQMLGYEISVREYQAESPTERLAIDPAVLASRLEYWFDDYKQDWRKVSRESELYRIQDVICFAADYLRTLTIMDSN